MADFDKISINGTYYNVKDTALTAAVNALTSEVGEVQETVTNQGQTIQQQGQTIQQQGQTIEDLSEKIENVKQMYVSIDKYSGTFDQKIASAIAECPFHGTVYIPAGEYNATQPITINKPITILGNYTGWDPEAIPTPEYSKTQITSTASIGVLVTSIGVNIKNIGLCTTPDAVGISLQVQNANNQVMRDFHVTNLYLTGNSDSNPSGVAIQCKTSIIVSSIEKVIIRNYKTGIELGAENVTSTSILIALVWVRTVWNIGIWLKGMIYSTLTSCVVEGGKPSGVVAGFYLGACHAMTLNSCGAEGITGPAINALYSTSLTVSSFASINCNSSAKWQVEIGNNSLVSGLYLVGSPKAGLYGDNCALIGASNLWYDASGNQHPVLKGIIDTTADKA